VERSSVAAMQTRSDIGDTDCGIALPAARAAVRDEVKVADAAAAAASPATGDAGGMPAWGSGAAERRRGGKVFAEKAGAADVLGEQPKGRQATAARSGG